MPLRATGKISAPRVNTDGTLPPIPSPPSTRHAISIGMLGASAEARPATAFKAKENSRQGLRPILSDSSPQTTPPINIPMNTAALRNSIHTRNMKVFYSKERYSKYTSTINIGITQLII